MQKQTFRSTGGHTFSPVDRRPVEIFTEDETDNIWPQQAVTADDGSKYTVLEIRHLHGRLYKIVLLPLDSAQ